MHILQDHLELLLEIMSPSFTVWNNQGVENNHKWRDTLTKRDTNNGGGSKRSSDSTTLKLTPITQIMLRQCRLLALRIACLQSDSGDKHVVEDWKLRSFREKLSEYKRYAKRLEERRDLSLEEDEWLRVVYKYEQFLGNLDEEYEIFDQEEVDEDYVDQQVDETEEEEDETENEDEIEQEDEQNDEDLDSQSFMTDNKVLQDEDSDDERPRKRRRSG